ncbi:hypothetical protein K469DRAFT_721512 [Zopfia rhizophila CBS 207.26]|uniref:Uncharacterized protein n=1 Tax=Zopfia rhizophila CBS 207.26 TaxID=1314779 RepID=A0A6A6EHM6_9PEZI|nr:hypothetical protein K469DRAFT_721512 [Zopfia rhizophila CBS 207.26]
MNLMIEAKDKEQAVFELMRMFKLPGIQLFNKVSLHVRRDENRPGKAKPKNTAKKGKEEDDGLDAMNEKIEVKEEKGPVLVPEDEIRTSGPERRVYWPPGMEEY